MPLGRGLLDAIPVILVALIVGCVVLRLGHCLETIFGSVAGRQQRSKEGRDYTLRAKQRDGRRIEEEEEEKRPSRHKRGN